MGNFYNSMRVRSYGSVFNFILGARNLGKTWAYKMRAIERFRKHGKKTCWVRRFAVESKKTIQDFYPKTMLEKLKIPVENIKYYGNKVFLKKNGKFEWFLEIVPLSAQQSLKSIDSPDEDTIIFDEFTTTISKYHQYRGDEVRDFLDLWTTKRRFHEVICFFLGNKESITNPYFDYFGIEPLQEEFQGIKTFKNHTIAVEQINDVPEISNNSYDKKVKTLLSGTEYSGYLFDGETKGIDKARIKQRPINSRLYACFDFGVPVSFYICNDGRGWFSTGIDKTRTICIDRPKPEYQTALVLMPKDRKLLKDIENCYKLHKLFFSSGIAEEQGLKIMKFFGLVL